MVELLSPWKKATPEVLRLGVPEPQRLGRRLLALGPWLALLAEQELRDKLRRVVDREPEARVGPRAPSGGRDVLRLGLASSLEGAREHTRWV